MVDPHANGCPEPEVLAAYVDRGLSLSERARADSHLASCPQCIALVAGAARTVAELSAHVPDDGVIAEATPLVTRRALAGALAAAAAVIAIVAAPSVVRPWLERDPGLVSLVDNVGEHRSVLGRLTGGFPHAPLDVPSAGGQDGRPAGPDRVQLASGKIRESFGDRTTPSELHAAGVSQLLAGNYDDAAQSLLAASREQPANARYLNDVATVQLERARRGLRPDDLPRALAAADRARRLDPSLREAWFNRALAASALSLTVEAKASWAEYLKRDSSSSWSAEARTRLDELAKPTLAEAWTAIAGQLEHAMDAAAADVAVRTHTTEARQFIEDRLLADWVKAVASGNSGATELERLRFMGDAMHRAAGDALYRDVVAAIDRAEARGARNAIAAAHGAYLEAQAIFAQELFAQAAPKLATARTALLSAGSPLAHRAAIDLAGTTMARIDYPGTLAAIASVKADGLANGYAFVVARAYWFEGLVAFAQGRLGDTQARYEDLLGQVEQMGDAEQRAHAHTLLASYYFYLGDRANEWRHRQVALEGLSVTRKPRFKSVLLATAAQSLRVDNPEAALLLYADALATARASGRPLVVLDILTQRATTLIALGRIDDAAVDVAEVRRELDAIAEPRLREAFELLVMAPEGELQRQLDPKVAIATASRALDIIKARNNPADRSRVPAFQLQLAKANIVSGNAAAANVALADGIRAFEAERALLADEGHISAFDQSWQLFETAVQLAIEEQDYPWAFEMSERARARTLAEARKAAPRPLASVQDDLRGDEAVVALNQFNNELVIWVIRRGDVNVVRRPMTRADAGRLVARQQDEIWHESAQPGASRDLYQEIVRPVSAHLLGASKIVFVPDQTYQNASFAALWDGSRQRFLIEERLVSAAPSVDAYAARRASGAPNAVRNPMVFGGPQPGADEEARAVGAIYSGSAVVTGASATRRRLLEDGPRYSLIHVATATGTSQSNPLLSRLVLADEAGRRHSGTVLGADIASRQMSQTNLVVIDEVETATARRGEGTLSLARAFMAAGVPAVLGTLPGANESAVRDLMIGFHHEMSRNVSAGQALQTVQRSAIQQNGRRLGAWSALVLYGSDR